jgi:hypothetical protein
MARTRPNGGYLGVNTSIGEYSASGMWNLKDVERSQRIGNTWPSDYSVHYNLNNVVPSNSNILFLKSIGDNKSNNYAFYDSSSRNVTITQTGASLAAQGAFSPYSPFGWSTYFNGAFLGGNYFTFNHIALGSGDFSFEVWIYPQNTGSASGSVLGNPIVSSDPAGGVNDRAFLVFIDGADRLAVGYRVQGSQGTYIFDPTPITISKWYHVAVTRISNTLRLYKDGVEVASAFNNTNFNMMNLIGYHSYSNYNYKGFMNNLRIIKGSSAYSGNTFSVPTTNLTADSNTIFLVMSGINNLDKGTSNTTLSDGGNRPENFSFSPFAKSISQYSNTDIGGSIYFDGTSDNLQMPTLDVYWGTGDFTVEAWVFTRTNTQQVIFTFGSNFYFRLKANYILEFYDGTTFHNTGSILVPPKQWVHVAVTRKNGVIRLYINGILSNSASTTSLVDYSTAPGLATPAVGHNATDGTNKFQGYISDLRISKGIARYTNPSFTLPTKPSTSDNNTIFLLNGSNLKIYDANSRTNIRTLGGAIVSSTNKKFSSNTIFFNGTNGYLNLTHTNNIANPVFAFGKGDFTIEFWINLSAKTASTRFFSTGTLFVGLTSTPTFQFYSNGATRIDSGFNPNLGQWYHFAVCRSSGTTRLFVDGIQRGSSYTDTNDYTSITHGPFIGYDASSTYMNGFIDQFSICLYAKYTSNFGVPKFPLPDQ